VGGRVVDLALARYSRGDLRRVALVYVGRRALRLVLGPSRKEPEVIYQAKLARRGGDLAVRTSRPLKRKLRSKAVRRALDAAYRADLSGRG
jgi:hypothetical protein